MVLVLLGILTAVAVPKYFDLQDESRMKAAQAVVAEAQSRINAAFSRFLLQGNGCRAAVALVNADLSKEGGVIADRHGKWFGDYQLEFGLLSGTGTAIPVKAFYMGELVSSEPVGMLAVPQCSGVGGVGTGITSLGLEAFANLGTTNGQAIASFQQGNQKENPNAAVAADLWNQLVPDLGEPFLGDAVQYWRVVNPSNGKNTSVFWTTEDIEHLSPAGTSKRVPFMQAQKQADGSVVYYVGMIGAHSLSENGKGALLIHESNSQIWNSQNYSGMGNYGGAQNSGEYYVLTKSGYSPTMTMNGSGYLSYSDAVAAYEYVMSLYKQGNNLTCQTCTR